MKPILLALTLLAASIPASSPAASILVATDSGNIGQFSFTNAGIVAGTATIDIAVPSLTSQVNTVNGEGIPPELVKVNTPLVLLATPTGGGFFDLALSPPNSATKTVGGTIGQQAILPFELNSGITPTNLPNFFNAAGFVTAVTANADPLYDFSNFANGKGSINLTFTATSFTGASNFSTFFATPGATAVGNGSFSQAAAVVPESASIVLLGSGLAILLACYRYRR